MRDELQGQINQRDKVTEDWSFFKHCVVFIASEYNQDAVNTYIAKP